MDEDGLGLVPRPARVEREGGSFEGGPRPAWRSDPACARSAASFAARAARWGLDPVRAGAGSADAALEWRLRPGEAAPGGYRLRVGRERIEVDAADEAGADAAAATLLQLAMTFDSRLPRVAVEDAPRFPWRGFMLDCCRNFFTVDFIEKALDAAALHKLDRFHWHLTDDQAWRLELPGRPLLREKAAWRRDRRFQAERLKGGMYSADDVRRVVGYAAERGIAVVPEIEIPGHATALLAAYPEFGCSGIAPEVEDRFGVFEDVMCPGSDALISFLEETIDAVASLFPAPWIHLGGDECPTVRWEACPRCAARVRAEGLRGPADLLPWTTARAARMALARGKVPLAWDEVDEAARDPGLPASARPPADLVAFAWRDKEKGRAAARSGRAVVMCPMDGGCYLDHFHRDSPEEPGIHFTATLRDSYASDPVLDGMAEAEAARVLGGQGNLWSEALYASRWAEYMAYPRLSALAEGFWTPRERRDFGSFLARMEVHGKRLDAMDWNRYRGLPD